MATTEFDETYDSGLEGVLQAQMLAYYESLGQMVNSIKLALALPARGADEHRKIREVLDLLGTHQHDLNALVEKHRARPEPAPPAPSPEPPTRVSPERKGLMEMRPAATSPSGVTYLWEGVPRSLTWDKMSEMLTGLSREKYGWLLEGTELEKIEEAQGTPGLIQLAFTKPVKLKAFEEPHDFWNMYWGELFQLLEEQAEADKEQAETTQEGT